MFPVFMAQLKKDIRRPFAIILFIVLSVLATVIFGNSAFGNQSPVPIFSSESNADEIEAKWLELLNESETAAFVIADEEEALEDVSKGRSEVAVRLLEDDYRLIAASSMSSIQLVEQEVHKVFMEEAQLKAAAGTKKLEDIRQEVRGYLETPPLTIQEQSLSGGEIPQFQMGMQLLFAFTLFCAMFTIAFKVNGLNADKVNGIWNRLILSPVNKTSMYSGHLFYSFSVGFFQLLIVFLIFQYILKVDLGRIEMILALAAVYTLSTVSLAMLFTGFLRTPEKFNKVFTSIIPIIPIISGAYMPPGTITSPVLIFIAKLFPLSHALDAMKDVSLYGAGWSDITLPIAIMLIIATVCMGVGINLVERGK